MRIIENYHYEYGAKKKSKKKSRILYGSTILLAVLVVGGIVLTQNTKKTTPAILQENAADISTSGTEVIVKNYNLSEVRLPTVGQAAIKVKGGRVWSSGTNDQAPMASLTKVVTALAVLEKSPLNIGESGNDITFTISDEHYYTDYLARLGTVTGVTAGQKISQYHALQAILLASSNNIADTLADTYFGGQNEFINHANSILQRLGLEDTKVADASGFNPNSVSTPSDLLKLGEYALEHPVIAEIVAQEEAYIMDNVRIPNYNALIGLDEITGIKPGFTDEAGYCLLFSADFKNKDNETEQFIAVVTGIQDRNAYFDTLRSIYDDAKNAIASQGD